MLFFFLFYPVTKKKRSLWAIVFYSLSTILLLFLQDYIPRKLTPFKIYYAFTTLCEFSFFTFFIWSNVKSKKFKQVIILASVGFVIFLSLYYSFAKFKRIDSVPIGVESLLILIFSFYFFYEQVNNKEVLFIYNNYTFWIITGIMIYISGSFFIYIFANQIPREDLNLYWSFTYIFLGIMNILFSIGILILGLQPTQKHHVKPKPNHHYLDIT